MRLFWLMLGWAALALGALGVVLPVLPTVPFMLVAAWAFAESSPKLRQRIREHPRYGQTVRNWQDKSIVPRLAKIWAVTAMSFGIGLSAWVGMPLWVVLAQTAICVAVAVYVISRPEA